MRESRKETVEKKKKEGKSRGRKDLDPGKKLKETETKELTRG